MFTGKPRTASVKARTPLVVYEICKEDLAPIIEQKPELSRQFSQTIIGRKDQLKSAIKNPEQKDKDITALVSEIARYFNIKNPPDSDTTDKDKAA